MDRTRAKYDHDYECIVYDGIGICDCGAQAERRMNPRKPRNREGWYLAREQGRLEAIQAAGHTLPHYLTDDSVVNFVAGFEISVETTTSKLGGITGDIIRRLREAFPEAEIRELVAYDDAVLDRKYEEEYTGRVWLYENQIGE